MTYKDPDKQREAECSNCGKEVPQTEGKRPRLYCDDACRKRMKRRTAHKLNRMADVINGQIINGHSIPDKPERVIKVLAMAATLLPSVIPKAEGVTNPCKYCGKQLDFTILECCSDCALKQPTKVSPAQDGHTLASRPALEFTGKMTGFESEHYRPASELKPGKYNSVSKPGDSHYGQA